MGLSDKQMLLLDTFMYSDITPKNSGASLETVLEQFTMRNYET